MGSPNVESEANPKARSGWCADPDPTARLVGGPNLTDGRRIRWAGQRGSGAFSFCVLPTQTVYTAHCRFRERIEENGFNTYASLHWHHHGRPMFLALDRRGVPRRGGQTNRHHLSTHFLPVLVS